jgi:hypothetical protein
MIEDIILTLDKIFENIIFDLEEHTFGDNTTKFCIIVGDFEFYMKDKKFKKWCDILRKKYPKVKWFCAYKNIK